MRRLWLAAFALAALQAAAEDYSKQILSIYREFQTAERRVGQFGVPLRYGSLADAGTNERAVLAAKAKLDRLPFNTMNPDEQLDYKIIANRIERALVSHHSAMKTTEDMSVLWMEAPCQEIARAAVTPDRFIESCNAIAAKPVDPHAATFIEANSYLSRMQEARDMIGRIRGRLAADKDANKDAVQKAGDRARAAIDAARKRLTATAKTLPGNQAPYAIGEEKFQFMIRYTDMLDKTPDELISLGYKYLAQTKQDMIDLAKQIAPDKTLDQVWQEILENHPQNGKDIIPLAEHNIQDALDLIKKEGFVTIPDYVSLCKVVEVGERDSPYYPYGAYSGGGMRNGVYSGNYIVNPGYSWMNAETLKKHLEGNNNIWTRVVAPHETYPGHHLQGGYAAANKDPIRRDTYSNTCVEGWGIYCEDLMFRHGYFPDLRYRLAQLRMRLWRCARVILDCSLHCKGVTQADAVDFLVKEVGLERVNAESEVRRYVTAPTQPLSYLNGWLGLTDLYESYKAKMGSAFVERNFHDQLLSLGSLPISLLRWRMMQSPPPVVGYSAP